MPPLPKPRRTTRTLLTTVTLLIVALLVSVSLSRVPRAPHFAPRQEKPKRERAEQEHARERRLAPTGPARATGVRIPCEAVPTRALLDPPPRHPSVHPRLHDSLLDAYPAWHAAQRRCLEIAADKRSCAPVLVWTCPPTTCDGAGDRMCGILFTYLLAVATERVFLVDWSTPAALSSSLHPAVVDWTLPPYLAALRREAKLHTMIDLPRLAWFRCLNNGGRMCDTEHSPSITALPARVVPSDYRFALVGNESLNFLSHDIMSHVARVRNLAIETRIVPRISNFLENTHLRRALIGVEASVQTVLQETNEAALLREVSHALFRTGPDLEDAMAARAEKLGDSYDAVHARLGGDLGEGGWDRFALMNKQRERTADELLKCLEMLRRDIGETAPGGKVYLATDTHEFKPVFAEAARRRGMEVVCNDLRAVHVNGVGGGGSGGAAECGGVRDVFADAWLLGQARVLVGTRSGFADFANRVGVVKMYGQVKVRGEKFSCRSVGTAGPRGRGL